MKQPIISYHQDELRDWVAELGCGHFQHVRHNPPWQVREWVVSPQGREQFIGYLLYCLKCDVDAPKDKIERAPNNSY
ncbi:DUF3565 domain-containing protein [Shewanella marina]|uniref:DUF3565 domain-containing protein n=1 Tax=Shewanella marina TaxID=487319 RepID=UPI00046EFA88|nr:DUF3565 domain-containing protein [Shewanella marina]